MATSPYKAQEAMKTCEEHEHKELSCFCKSCKKFICISCGQTTHHGHNWDLIASIAKERRVETPKLCRNIKKENLPKCLKLRKINKIITKERDEDFKKLEERRSILTDTINRIINEQKRKRNDLVIKASEMEKKLDYLENITISLDSNISAYNDFDLLEMEQEMLTTLQVVEAYDVDSAATAVKFVPGEIDEGLIAKMIGEMQETMMTYVDDEVHIEEEKSFKEFDRTITTIASISDTQAWVGDTSNEIELISSQNENAHRMTFKTFYDAIALCTDNLIATNPSKQTIQRVSSHGKESVIVNTKPLHPSLISKTHTGDILVTLMDAGYRYKLHSSSRRLVQRMTLTGKVLNTYEFREDGKTRLFTYPRRTAENANSDVCVINRTSEDAGELIVLHWDGRVRATYRGHEGFEIIPGDVACDSKRRIIVTDFFNKCLHLLSPDATFLRYLLSGMFDYPTTIALYKNKLWIGFNEGTVKVHKYIE